MPLLTLILRFRAALALLCSGVLAGCAGGHLRPAAPPPAWPMAVSDVAPDPAFRFATLSNGMRTIVRSNATPAGTAMIRMVVDAGSRDETEAQRGFAHFVEHMAFAGSRHVPTGEMVRLLQRQGLAFGADTNASTSFERTIYQLDLPRNDPALLNTALMLMRETASELTFAPGAVARERGVVLSEMRDRRGYQQADWQDMAGFLTPKARYLHRLPIGSAKAVGGTDAAALAAFWHAHYRPDTVTLVVVGDFAPAVLAQAIDAHFGDWPRPPGPPPPRPDRGSVDPARADKVDIWIDPALTERVTLSRQGLWTEEPDTIANRRRALLRLIGTSMIDRRFQSVARRADPPFRGAGFGTARMPHIGRTTNLVIDTPDGQWRKGMIAAAAMLHQALRDGFSQAELDEQVAGLRSQFENAAAGADTRSDSALMAVALAVVTDDRVPATPADALARFAVFAPTITPASVMAALRADMVPLDAPLIRFRGRRAPDGGAAALRAAWADGAGATASVYTPVSGTFAYGDFGAADVVVADTRDPALGIRRLRFANGVRLNLRHTDLDHDRISVAVAVAGGEPVATRANPLAVAMVPSLAQGGLGRHSADDLQTLLAGHAVGATLVPDGDAFVVDATVPPRDLALECSLITALITDPGYRAEAELSYHQSMANLLARRDATPGSALGFALGAIVSDHDPRFSTADAAAYRALTFAQLRHDIGDRLTHGAVEIGMVGDLDENAAIAAVARTLGALPLREAEFRPDPAALERHFTAARKSTVVRHNGLADQAIVRLEWPTTDDRDAQTDAALDLLQAVVTIAVEDTVRVAMGKSYSPGATASQSDLWPGWGTFAVQAAVATRDVNPARAAIRRTIAALITGPIDPDLIERARAPQLQRLDNWLKGNGGWLSLVARAQSHPDRIVRYQAARGILQRLTPDDVQALAARYLAPDAAVEVLVLPSGAAVPGELAR